MLNLSKGQKISLTKEAPGLTKMTLGLKWGAQQYDGQSDFDLDATVFMLDANERVASDDRIIGYMNPNKQDKDGSVIYGGDNRTGGSGDEFDENMIIDLTKVPADVEKLALVCTIYEAKTRNQTFGMVSNSMLTAINNDTNQPIFTFDLGEDFSCETAIIAAEVYRHNGEWKFNALSSGYAGGLADICKRYGIDAEGGN